ncbi:MAG: ABC transporter substrate-binding protein [Desulfitobacteriia bacterium]|jgi:branched-chain amino acid transport system substrate-binding protein
MKKVFTVVLCILLAVTMATGCASQAAAPAADDDVIKIGIFEPLTGPNAAGGELEVEGMKLANELYPEVLGKKVELVIVDNKSDKAEAANAVIRLIEKEKVSAIIGSWGSSLSMAAGAPILENKMPTVGASCTNPLVTKDNDYYFRVCFIDPFQGTVMARYAYNSLGAKKAAIIQELSNDYAVGLASFFKEEFIKLTGDPDSVVEVSNYQTNDTDFTAQLTNIKGKNPDVIFAPGNFTESAMIVKQARTLGIETPFIGGDTWETDEFIQVGGDAVEGVVFSTFFDSSVALTPETDIFLDAFAKAYPDRQPAAVTALGYDAYLLILDAIERAGSTDPVAIRDAIAATKAFPGAAGPVTLDENGDAIKDAIIKTVKDGKFTYMDTVKAE